MLSRQDWLILFIGEPGGPHSLDQIRIMKGMFLLDQTGPQTVRGLFRFEPFSFGPFDKSIYADLDNLEERGLIRVEATDATSRRLYRLTSSGREKWQTLRTHLSDEEARVLGAVKKQVTSVSFTELLRRIYADYPEFAVRSVANV